VSTVHKQLKENVYAVCMWWVYGILHNKSGSL
jgi:hypothetical protein